MTSTPRVPTNRFNRGLCLLMCGRPGTTSCCGYRVCTECVGRLRAIAVDAGVPIDEELLGGSARTLNRRQLTKAEQRLDQQLERREIDRARRGVG